MRLRVVEEYEVALLAESPDDAKARAEAEVRGGGEFEAIQDSLRVPGGTPLSA